MGVSNNNVIPCLIEEIDADQLHSRDVNGMSGSMINNIEYNSIIIPMDIVNHEYQSFSGRYDNRFFFTSNVVNVNGKSTVV